MKNISAVESKLKLLGYKTWCKNDFSIVGDKEGKKEVYQFNSEGEINTQLFNSDFKHASASKYFLTLLVDRVSSTSISVYTSNNFNNKVAGFNTSAFNLSCWEECAWDIPIYGLSLPRKYIIITKDGVVYELSVTNNRNFISLGMSMYCKIDHREGLYKIYTEQESMSNKEMVQIASIPFDLKTIEIIRNPMIYTIDTKVLHR